MGGGPRSLARLPSPRRRPHWAPAARRESLALSLTGDGRLADAIQLARVASAAATASDCFLFCPGGLEDGAEARHDWARFFALLDGALAPAREQIAPLRLGLHWPSRPFPPLPPRPDAPATGLWPEVGRRVATPARGRGGRHRGLELLRDLGAAEIPRSPEEEAELDALAGLLARAERTAPPVSPFQALTFWVMKRRATDVGERFGRECLVPLWRALAPPPRLHLIGHAVGASLVTAMVLGGVRPASLTLLRAPFSAFAFAPEVPGFDRPGFHYRLLAERRIDGPVVVLRCDGDPGLGAFYRAIGEPGDIAGHGARDARRLSGRRGRADIVAASALGAVGARGVGAPELDLLDAPHTGIPRYPIVNVDGSGAMRPRARWATAPGDVFPREVATLAALAAGLLVGGPDGARTPPRDPRFDR
jgi:hypothetical protein